MCVGLWVGFFEGGVCCFEVLISFIFCKGTGIISMTSLMYHDVIVSGVRMNLSF